VSLDERGRVIDANQAAQALFGSSAAELEKRALADLMPELPADLTKTRAFATQARHRDGGMLPVEASFGAVTVAGRPMYIGVVRDITERTAMEERLRERDQYLDRALRVAAAAEMASALAHELNQPLTA